MKRWALMSERVSMEPGAPSAQMPFPVGLLTDGPVIGGDGS